MRRWHGRCTADSSGLSFRAAGREYRAPDALHICDSTEALTALAAAGYGTAVLPLLPGLARVPLAGVQALSFGAYYKTLRDRPLLKEFLACPFAPPLPGKEALNHDDP